MTFSSSIKNRNTHLSKLLCYTATLLISSQAFTSTYLFVADYDAGTQAYDVSNPSKPRFLSNFPNISGSGHYSYDVHSKSIGDKMYLFVADYGDPSTFASPGTQVFDITNFPFPTSPSAVLNNYAATPGRSVGITTGEVGNHNYLFVADGGSQGTTGTLAFDITGITSGIFPVTPSGAFQNQLGINNISQSVVTYKQGSKTYLFVANEGTTSLADEQDGIQIFDITNIPSGAFPTSPSAVLKNDFYDASIDASVRRLNIHEIGGRSYLFSAAPNTVKREAGAAVFDITDMHKGVFPSGPSATFANLAPFGSSNDVTSYDIGGRSYLFVADNGSGFYGMPGTQIFDVTDSPKGVFPDSPIVVLNNNSVNPSTFLDCNAAGVAVHTIGSGVYLFIADGAYTQIFDVSLLPLGDYPDTPIASLTAHGSAFKVSLIDTPQPQSAPQILTVLETLSSSSSPSPSPLPVSSPSPESSPIFLLSPSPLPEPSPTSSPDLSLSSPVPSPTSSPDLSLSSPAPSSVSPPSLSLSLEPSPSPAPSPSVALSSSAPLLIDPSILIPLPLPFALMLPQPPPYNPNTDATAINRVNGSGLGNTASTATSLSFMNSKVISHNAKVALSLQGKKAEKNNDVAMVGGLDPSLMVAGLFDRVQAPANVQSKGSRNPFLAWVTGLVEYNHLSAVDHSPETNLFSQAALLGLDYSVDKRNVVGGYMGYTHTYYNTDPRGVKGDINYYNLGVYGTAVIGQVYLEPALMTGFAQTHNSRAGVAPGVSDKAKADFSTWVFTPHLEVGYQIAFDWGSIIPFNSTDWSLGWQEDYHEHGAGIYDVYQNSLSTSILRNETGFYCCEMWNYNWGAFLLAEKASYVALVPLGSDGVNAAFFGAPGSFTLDVAKQTLHLGSVRLDGIWMIGCKRPVEVNIGYTGEFGANYWSSQIMLDIGKRF